MAALTDTLELRPMRLASGEGRRFELAVHLDDFVFGEDTYVVSPVAIALVLDLSRTTHEGYALRLRLQASIHGPCMRCLTDATIAATVDAREVDQPSGGDELDSPHIDKDEVLDVAGWAREAFGLALPAQVLCRPGCLGICAECGIDLNTAPPDHHHERPPDPRWAKLADLTFEENQ